MEKLYKWLRTHAALIAFAILTIGVMAAVGEVVQHGSVLLYQSQIGSCERGNSLRQEINGRVDASSVQRSALLQFISSAETARRANYKSTHLHSDLVAARRYAALGRSVRAKVHYHFVPLVNCQSVIQKP